MGAGSTVGAIDNPTQRGVQTDHPLIAGSSPEGAVRDHFSRDWEDEKLITRRFGPGKDENVSLHAGAGAIAFIDAALLAFIMRVEFGVTMDRYEIIIYWSDDDEAFVAEVPELPGCMAHGPTQEDALAQAKEAMSLWVETAEADGQPVPAPKGRRLMYA
jgi:predicted RNase H-like HicB family nuclease